MRRAKTSLSLLSSPFWAVGRKRPPLCGGPPFASPSSCTIGTVEASDRCLTTHSALSPCSSPGPPASTLNPARLSNSELGQEKVEFWRLADRSTGRVSNPLSMRMKLPRYESRAIYIRYTYENKGPVRRTCEPPHKINPEIAARPLSDRLLNLLDFSKLFTGPPNGRYTPPPDKNIGGGGAKWWASMPQRGQQKRARENCRISTFGCPPYW